MTDYHLDLESIKSIQMCDVQKCMCDESVLKVWEKCEVKC
jgi:hypothetical protein